MAGFAGKFESRKQEWETPQGLFDDLHAEFGFTCDVAADATNRKCDIYFSPENSGLTQEWAGVCWMNPPYGQTGKWIEKAYRESQNGATVVCLVPARTNTNWWHDYCLRGEVRLLRGRPKFGGATHGLPQPLAVIVFRQKREDKRWTEVRVSQ